MTSTLNQNNNASKSSLTVLWSELQLKNIELQHYPAELQNYLPELQNCCDKTRAELQKT